MYVYVYVHERDMFCYLKKLKTLINNDDVNDALSGYHSVNVTLVLINIHTTLCI